MARDSVTVEMGRSTVEVRETDDGFEAVEATQSFEAYLDENVFTAGSYTYQTSDSSWVDIKVAEYDDGSGHVVSSDLERAIADENVSLRSITDGWLKLQDDR